MKRPDLNPETMTPINLSFLTYLLGVIALFILTSCNQDSVQSSIDSSTLPTPTAMLAESVVSDQVESENDNSSAAQAETTTNSIGSDESITQVFSLSKSETSVPADILPEIAYFTGGGGGTGCPLDDIPNSPVMGYTEVDVELHDAVNVATCGWNIGDSIQMKVLDADGNPVDFLIQTFVPDTMTAEKMRSDIDIVDSGAKAAFIYKSDVLKHSPGLYTLQFTDPSGRIVEHRVEIGSPEGPRFYWNDDGSLLLHNFSPGEKVRIFAYVTTNQTNEMGSTVYRLLAWQEFEVWKNGQLLVETDFGERIDWIAAVGEMAGEVSPDYRSSPRVFGIYSQSIVRENDLEEPSETQTELSWPISATGIEACHLRDNDDAYAGANARLWSEPNVDNGSVVAEAGVSELISIISGPTWGKIRRDIDSSGWWWEVEIKTTGERGWLWQDRIAECIEK